MAKQNVFTILEDLKDGLDDLRKALEPLASIAVKETRKSLKRGRKAARKAVKRNLPKAKKQLRILQGKYMTAVRSLSKIQKAQVKKLRASKGYKEALKFARGLAK